LTEVERVLNSLKVTLGEVPAWSEMASWGIFNAVALDELALKLYEIGRGIQSLRVFRHSATKAYGLVTVYLKRIGRALLSMFLDIPFLVELSSSAKSRVREAMRVVIQSFVPDCSDELVDDIMEDLFLMHFKTAHYMSNIPLRTEAVTFSSPAALFIIHILKSVNLWLHVDLALAGPLQQAFIIDALANNNVEICFGVLNIYISDTSQIPGMSIRYRSTKTTS